MKVSAPAKDRLSPEPLFLDGRAGPIFSVHFAPAETAAHARDTAVLYLPPFAEEMNRARRMASMLGRRLALAGVGCLVLDPYGTGDSGGEFAQANWQLWRDDATAGLSWLREHEYAKVAVLGLRLGSCLALDLAAAPNSGVSKVILWSPILRGELFLNQFLRIRTMAGIAGASGGETAKELRERLRGGETLEVAGYAVAPALAEAIIGLDLVALGKNCPAPIHWFEVGGEAGDDSTPPLSPAVAKAAQGLREAGAELQVTRVAGEPFWSIEETVLVPELLDATLGLWRA